MKKIFLSILLTLIILTVTSQVAYASESIRITPAYISLHDNGGQSSYENLSIFNKSTQSLNLNITPEKITYNGKKLIYTPRNNDILNIAGWINLSEKNVNISPQSTINVPLTINVPKNTPNGSYNGGILVSVTQSQKGNITINGNIIVNVFINIGPSKEKISNLSITVKKYPKITFSNKIPISYGVYNGSDYNNAFLNSIYDNGVFSKKKISGPNLINILTKQERNEVQTIPLYIGYNKINIHIQNIGNSTTQDSYITIVYLPYYIVIPLIIILAAIVFFIIKRKKQHGD